ncbi:MAG TPA: DNA-binding domain-containing protein, partial [Arachidicoccus sp.]
MQPLTKTFEQQSKLAFFCRTGKYETLENVNENNVYHYRRLVFNVVEDMLQSAYPLASELLTKEEWINVTKDFFANHPCVSPQVWSMPKEFYEYLFAIEHHPLMTKYPFLQELLWFEWLEVEMYMMEDKSP